jgi:uncharacterized membrane protein (GlpM family)
VLYIWLLLIPTFMLVTGVRASNEHKQESTETQRRFALEDVILYLIFTLLGFKSEYSVRSWFGCS